MQTAVLCKQPQLAKCFRTTCLHAQQADKRARREGHVPDDYGQKSCTLCHQQKDLLIRCRPVVCCTCVVGHLKQIEVHRLLRFCTMFAGSVLHRCQIDKSETWHMVCGKCWRTVSGGIVDGDDQHPDYRCCFGCDYHAPIFGHCQC